MFMASAQQLALVANTLGMLSVDMTNAANSGHPGAPLGMRHLHASLLLNYAVYDHERPRFYGRSPIFWSNGHASALAYSGLHLAGYRLSMDELRSFRQLDSLCAGHPEFRLCPGIESTTGPLGQGIANAVGYAIAERMLAARFNTNSHKLFGQQPVWCFAGDGCMMEGVGYEALSFAASNGLGNLVVIYDSNDITIDGKTSQTFRPNAKGYFRALGCRVMEIDGHDLGQIDKALSWAKKGRYGSKPSIIIARTTIGKDCPELAGTSSIHGSPIGADLRKQLAAALNWPEELFHVPQEVTQLFRQRREETAGELDRLDRLFERWSTADAGSQVYDGMVKMSIPDQLDQRLLAAIQTDKPTATRKFLGQMLSVLGSELPGLVGGSADLAGSTGTDKLGHGVFFAENPNGRIVRFGVREHAMASICNGMANHGAFRSFGATFLQFANYGMMASLRLAAMSRLPTLTLFTHDSIGLGEDGPTHQGLEHLMQLRMIPGVHVWRPANADEAAFAMIHSLSRNDGPSVQVFTRQDVAVIPRGNVAAAYVIAGKKVDEGAPSITFVATGSELPLAIAVAQNWPNSRVVSVPCADLLREDTELRSRLIPPNSPVVWIEAGATMGAESICGTGGENFLAFGVDTYQHSAPGHILYEQAGLTVEAITAAVQKRFPV